MKNGVQRIETGVAHLDGILGGGLPIRSVTMLSGPPGSGKTILAQQIGFHYASVRHPALFFSTLSEPAAKTLRYLSAFDFAEATKVGRDVHFVDLGVIMRSEGLATAASLILHHLKAVKPAFVVIDSFKVFDDLSDSRRELRKFGYEVAVSLMAWETTALLLGEYAPMEQETNPVFSIVDGLFQMSQRESLGEHARYLKVIKMRGTGHSRDDQAFSISRAGISMYPPKVAILRQVPSPASAGRCLTGIEKIDELLGPGIPWGSSVLLSGVAGTGKTVLGLEFLYRGAEEGQKGILFSFEETPERLLATAEGMGWKFQEQIDRGMIEIVFIPQPDIRVEEHILMIRDKIEARQARRVVIDSVSVFLHKVTEPQIAREKIFHLCTIVQNARCVGLFATDIPYGSIQLGRWGVEETVVDGIIVLSFTEEDNERQRYIEVYKLRNTAHFRGRHNLVIEHGGLSVFPRYGLDEDPGKRSVPPSTPRLGWGIKGLDALMGNGLLRRSVTLISGSAGIGKSTMGLQFLLEGARRGEKGLYVTLEERPEQLMASADSLKLPLRSAVKKRLIEIHWVTRERLRAGQFLTVIADKLERSKARRVVIDAAAHMVTERRLSDELGIVLQKLAVRFKSLGVTSVISLESPLLYSTRFSSGRNLSPIADNVLLLRYQDTVGRLDATLTVVKTRGSENDRGTFFVTIGRGGMRVGARVGLPVAEAERRKSR